MPKPISFILWLAVAMTGAWSFSVIARERGETVGSGTIVVAAICTYAIGYRFYSKWIATRALMLDDRRSTPCEVREDGHDFVKTSPWIVFGHHFAAISGPGPLVGPVLAAQFGYLPGTLWILLGVVLGGAVQDFIILFGSMRRNGRSLGQMIREELNPWVGTIALVAVLAIMIILLAVLGLVVVQVLAESPWGVFTVGATIPIAMAMGGYLRFGRAGKTLEASIAGVALLLLAVWGGQYVSSQETLASVFTLKQEPLAWTIIVYGLAASVLPVWLLLAPRDYLSTFMKLGTILALAVGVLWVLPALRMPAVVDFAVAGNGLVVAGKLFPFCFITIACGAISGFHSLISSGITPKIITRERFARPVGYGAMLLESLVAIMALIAACTLDPGVYLAMNVKGVGADDAARVADILQRVNATGFHLAPGTLEGIAAEVQEHSLYGRTGGAATLAVGMAQVFKQITGGHGLGLWYHFAIMFEALFILTTLDAGTRVGRYLVQDFLSHLHPRLGDTRAIGPNLLASVLVVGGWGWFLVQGVRDPLGGINSLWPLFGIANQLLASIALVLGTTLLLKMALARRRSAAVALVTLIPLCWLLTVTFTAGWQKMFHPQPRIGFLAAMRDFDAKLPAAEQALARATTPDAIRAATKAVSENRARRTNNLVDLVVTALFLTLAATVVAIAVWEWWRMLRGTRAPDLRETAPVWRPPDPATPPSMAPAGACALLLGVARQISDQDAIDRAVDRTLTAQDPCSPRILIDVEEVREAVEHEVRGQAYADTVARRFNSPNRCC